MRPSRGLCALSAAASILVIVVFASTASAAELPKISLLPGDTYPASAEGSSKASNFLETEIGEKIEESEVKVKLELLEAGASGPGTVDLIGVKEPRSKSPCNTAGDAEGVVLISGEYHLVFTKKEPLEVGVLLTYPTVAVTCGKIKIKLSGEVIGKVVAPFSTDITTLGLVFNCSAKGKQALSSYFNDEGLTVSKQLILVNFGLGNENACKSIGEEVKGVSSKMGVITG